MSLAARVEDGFEAFKPAVPVTRWSATAVVILAGHQDGGAAACAAAPSCPGVSAVKKTFGKAGPAGFPFSPARCLEAWQMRTWRSGMASAATQCQAHSLHFSGCDAGVPPDDCVRALDALAALAKTEIYASNQLFLAAWYPWSTSVLSVGAPLALRPRRPEEEHFRAGNASQHTSGPLCPGVCLPTAD